jgi:hypothetical protein
MSISLILLIWIVSSFVVGTITGTIIKKVNPVDEGDENHYN